MLGLSKIGEMSVTCCVMRQSKLRHDNTIIHNVRILSDNGVTPHIIQPQFFPIILNARFQFSRHENLVRKEAHQ